MKNGTTERMEHEHASQRVGAHFRSRILGRYVAAKLRTDPMFPAAYELLCDSSEPIVDVGCGVGLLPFYLRERNVRLPITGIDCDAAKIDRANAIAAHYDDLEFIAQDVRQPLSAAGTILLFDLLHYLRPPEQAQLLEQLAHCVAPGGMLLIRDCPRDANARYWITYIVERFGQIVSWNLAGRLYYPSRESIRAAFANTQFCLTIEPLWGRTPFNSYLFLLRKQPAAEMKSLSEHDEPKVSRQLS
jgi:2-polyprenyl-3-methyl-5-hydroxy-6-metoxy-1,4-benzoquinol methylase